MFLYDPERSFELKTISKRLNIRPALVKKHLQNLVEIKFISRKAAKGENIFRVNKDFGFYKELKALAAKISPASEEKMLKRVAGLGKVKLAVISGIFINFDNARADLLVVGENIKPAKFNKFLKDLNLTFRRDEESGRPRANKVDSQMDRKQKKEGKLYYS